MEGNVFSEGFRYLHKVCVVLPWCGDDALGGGESLTVSNFAAGTKVSVMFHGNRLEAMS